MTIAIIGAVVYATFFWWWGSPNRGRKPDYGSVAPPTLPERIHVTSLGAAFGGTVWGLVAIIIHLF